MTDTLRGFLVARLQRTGRSGEDLVFGRTATEPFSRHVSKQAADAWAEHDPPLARLTLHGARHSFSTYLDAAGISETRADRYMGHSNGSVAGRYRHQLAGQLVHDAQTLDAYLPGAWRGRSSRWARRASLSTPRL